MVNFVVSKLCILFCAIVMSYLLAEPTSAASLNVSNYDRDSRVIQLCGFRSEERPKLGINRVVGGSVAEKNEFPWQVSIQWAYKASTYHVCGAAIVGQQWVLTAAHCTMDFRIETLLFVAGEHLMKVQEGSEQIRKASKHFQHELYDSVTQENDISLIKMEAPFVFDPLTVAPVCLPAPQETFTGDCVVSGWGKLKEGGTNSDVIQKVWLPIIPDGQCREKMKLIGYKGPVKDSMMCAGFPQGGQDACQGDSGGPFVCPGKGNLPILAGIVSWGIGCARKDIPGVYTEVSQFVGWINGKISADAASTIQIARPVDDNIIFWEQKRKGVGQNLIKKEEEKDDDNEEDDDEKTDDETTTTSRTTTATTSKTSTATTSKTTTTASSVTTTPLGIKGSHEVSQQETIWGENSAGKPPLHPTKENESTRLDDLNEVPQKDAEPSQLTLMGIGFESALTLNNPTASQPALKLHSISKFDTASSEEEEDNSNIRGVSKVPVNANPEDIWGGPGLLQETPVGSPVDPVSIPGHWIDSSEENSSEEILVNPYQQMFYSRNFYQR